LDRLGFIGLISVLVISLSAFASAVAVGLFRLQRCDCAQQRLRFWPRCVACDQQVSAAALGKHGSGRARIEQLSVQDGHQVAVTAINLFRFPDAEHRLEIVGRDLVQAGRVLQRFASQMVIGLGWLPGMKIIRTRMANARYPVAAA
jgi:hypothetical protein